MPIKYITKKYHRQIFFTPKKPLIVRLRNRDVARRFCESSRHISRPCNLQPHQQRCANKISNPKPQYNFHTYIRNTTSPKFPQKFSLLAAIHLFARSVTKSKISTSPAKKLVAATDGVYLILFFKSFIRIYLPILQAAECNHAATNSVILYINKTH